MTTFKPKFWKPDAQAPGTSINEEKASGVTGTPTTSVVYNPHRSLSIEQQRQRLPVFHHRNHILYLIEKYRTVVIVGETGCGKSTQLPQYLLEAGWGGNGNVIAVTQPRRVATITVATRVAEERGAILGNEIGYVIRFDDCSDQNATRVKFVTDGILIREMMQDPLLSQYSAIMLDEAHERTLYTDIIVGLLKKIQIKRPELRIIIASATLDAEKFCKFFNTNESQDPEQDTAAILTVEGRMYPVETHFALDPVPDYLKSTVDTIKRIHEGHPTGDVLAFLTGLEEVDQVVRILIEYARQLPKDSMKLQILPMYGSLPAGEQMRVFARTPQNCRKIVVATNIAETSITINGIVYVVDAGFVKMPAFNPKHGIDSLVIVPISQASARQRAGRAGRVRTGKAYRLYTEEEYSKLPQQTVPEMQRSNMSAVVLQLKALGIDNVLRFNFISAPPAENLIIGLEQLFALGALDENCRLTHPLGLLMAEFPLPPMFAKMLLSSGEYGCSEEVVTIAAMMQIHNTFVTPSREKAAADRAKRKFSTAEGDLITMLNVYKAFLQFKKNSSWCKANFVNYKGMVRAGEIRAQLSRLLTRCGVKMVSCGDDVESILKCITMGFFTNAARYHPTGVYRTVRDGHELVVHPTSVLYVEMPAPLVLYTEVVHTNREYMRDISVIKSTWLHELAPHYYQHGTERELNAKRAKLE